MAAPRKKAAPKAKVVDETVVNQEHPGTSAVNRDPDPQLVTDTNSGVTFDISKSPAPEIVKDDSDEAEKNRLRQTSAALDGRTEKSNNDESFTIAFLETGLTYAQRVWKRGEEVQVPKDRAKLWMEMTPEAQIDRWGKVKFEKR